MKNKEVIRNYLVQKIYDSVSEILQEGRYKNRAALEEKLEGFEKEKVIYEASRFYAVAEDIQKYIFDIWELDEEKGQ